MMKKTAFIILLTVLAVSAEAQTMYDALRFSENEYEGTARTLAMGNAFTALGGDLGSVNINPAGSAVARYSQITVTPGMAISINKAQGTYFPGTDQFSGYEKALRNNESSFTLPNIGLSINFNTHRKKGIKNVSVGFVSNVTNTWMDGVHAAGTNNRTSFTGAMAAGAEGLFIDDILDDNAYNKFVPAEWNYITAAKAGIIDIFQKLDNDTYAGDVYAGAAENIIESFDKENNVYNYDISLGGPLSQSYQRTNFGRKYDYVLNAAMNISDIVFIGINFGLTSLTYRSEEINIENTLESDLFQTGLKSMKFKNFYNASGVGVYGKLGIIVTPFAGLRIGGAIQTPTATTINEIWGVSASTTFADSRNNASAQSPDGEYSYILSSPFRYNLGAAYAFGKFAVISADYESCNYKSMYFRELDSFDKSGFEGTNSDIRDYMGTSNMFRAGVEIKPTEGFAIRAGYGLTTSPEKFLNEYGELEKSKAHTNKYSFGLGYSTKGSFFADLAIAAKTFSKEYIYPYADYIENVYSPEILNRKTILTAALTIGFRF